MNLKNKIEKGMIVNFKAKIKSFYISDISLTIEDLFGNIYKVNADYRLLKKIILNNECIFLNFVKKNNYEFNITNLSDIQGKENETFVEFNFINYEDNKLYNYIRIDNILYKIKNNSIKIKIDVKSNKNIFIKEIFFDRIEKDKLIHSFNYCYEINRGKINHIEAFLGKGGFSYEFYIKSLKKEALPKNISIVIDDKIININNNDKFLNELQERFIIANIPKQSINTIFNSSNKEIDSKDGKFLILIKEKNEKNIMHFIKDKNYTDIKKNFEIPENIRLEIQKLFEKYINDDTICIEKYRDSNEKFPNLDTKTNISKDISQLFLRLLNGFNEFTFCNSKKDYDNVKYLSFILLYRYLSEAKNYFYIYTANYKSLLKSIVNLDYIDRIKVLITFISNYYSNLFEEKLVKTSNNVFKKKMIGPTDDFLVLINIDDKNRINKYSYIKSAFEILYKIIDELSEDCALFKIIQQFNCLIYEESLTKKKMYSGSILNLNDVKLELVKNNNRFIILSEKERKYLDNYAFFRDISLTVTINIKSIMSQSSNNLNFETTFNNLISVFLFLFIHEILGHKKSNINNEDIGTPRAFNGINYEELLSGDSDAAIFLEKIIFGKLFNPNILMKNKNPQIFLNEKLYVGKNFEKLHKLYSEFEKNVNDNHIKEQEERKNYNLDLKKNFNKSGQDLINENISDEEEEENHLLFHDLFEIYGDLTEEEKIKNQNNIEYQRFLFLYDKKKNRKKYTLENLK